MRPRLGRGIKPRAVAQLAAALPAASWRRRTITEGSKGPLVAEFAAVRVIAVRDGLPGPEVWLVLRRHPLTGELKTYLSNAPAKTSLATLVRQSGMRWPIETCFADGKQYLGMGEYEVRSWRGWHHHMPLVILAHFFLVRVQLSLKKAPGLTCRRGRCCCSGSCPSGSLTPSGS
jgi:SRSO17 transposase